MGDIGDDEELALVETKNDYMGIFEVAVILRLSLMIMVAFCNCRIFLFLWNLHHLQFLRLCLHHQLDCSSKEHIKKVISFSSMARAEEKKLDFLEFYKCSFDNNKQVVKVVEETYIYPAAQRLVKELDALQ